jgi:hypothetical protein
MFCHGFSRNPGWTRLVVFLSAFLASGNAAAVSPSFEEAEAYVPPWLRGLVSPSKGFPSTAPDRSGDALAALTFAFPAWLTETGRLDANLMAGTDPVTKRSLRFPICLPDTHITRS